MPAPGALRRLIAVMFAAAAAAAFAGLPTAARAQHTKLSLESIGPNGGNSGQPADLVGVRSVGKRALIRTFEPLVAGDSDASTDLYERTGSGTTLLSTGPTGGNGAYPASVGDVVDAGHTAYFHTEERLVAADTDDALDIYSRTGGTTTLVSTGPAGGNGAYDAYLSAATPDGSHVYFWTLESLVAADTDSSIDVYERAGGTTTLVSTGPTGGNGDPGAEFVGVSDDGQRVFFTTQESLVAGDTDNAMDVYERSGGTSTVVSTGPAGGNGDFDVRFGLITPDGTHFFFGTAESLVAADTDSGFDVYERTGGTTTIHSIGPSGGNGGPNASLVGISDAGSRVFIETAERLNTTTDRDGLVDVYESSGGTVTLLTPGANTLNGATNAYFVRASKDGTRVFVRTEEAIAAPDTDGAQDIYLLQSGTVSLVSTGPGGGNGPIDAYFAGASEDGTHVFIQTIESLDAADTDTNSDVYERYGGVTSLLTNGATGGNGDYDATFRGASADGTRVFFRTAEALVSTDTDQAMDIYSANVPGTVTVQLDAMPDAAQDFTFTAVGLEPGGFNFGPLGFGPTTFQLDDDLDPALSDAEVFTQVPPGEGYSVTQTVPPGWDLKSASCDDGSPTGNIDVSAGEDVTCTFTDHRRGRVVVTVDAVPDDAQDFSFTAGGGLTPTSFSLDDDADGTLPSTITLDDVPTGGGYSVSQSLPPGWDQASATCSDGSPVGNINLSPDETVTCTFTNRKRGQIVVVKDATPNDAQDFSFSAGGGLSPASFLLDDDSDGTLSNTRTFTDVAPGSGYSIAETVPSGWNQASATCDDGSPVSNIDVSPGETVTCTFANDRRGRIVVVKDAQPNDPQDFSFTATGGLSPNSFSLDDDSDGTLSNTRTFDDLVPKSYSVSESVPSGWDQSSATCDDGSPVSSIDVGPGETVTCTFTNKKRGQIVIVKDAVPNNGQNFTFTAAGGLSPTSFELDDDNNPQLSNTRTFTNVVARNGYSVVETQPNGWSQGSATCDDGSPVTNIDVGPAETVTCTFVNLRNGSLTIVKDAVPNDPQDFAFTVGGGLSPASFALDDDSNGTLSNTQAYSNVPAGVYSASETIPPGWDQTAATCNDGSPVSAIDVGANENVTCTFTNQKRGRIVALLDAQPNDPQDFSFAAGGGLAPASFTLDDDSDPGLSNTQTFNDVLAGGGYSLAAIGIPSAWALGGATCDDGSPVTNINVAAGEVVTCTFTIQKRGQIVVVKDATPDDPQDFSFTAGGGLSPSSFSLDDDSDGTLSNTRTFASVAPGGYSISETVPGGWDQTAATCDDGSPVTNIDVGPAEIVTCTFSNRKRGRVVVTKDATPDDPQDFSFTAGGGLSPASFALDDDADGTLSNTHTFNDVVPGSGYTVAETVPGGWDQTGATCDDGSPVTNISVSAGETVTCSFQNRKRAHLLVVKDSVPDDPQDFVFNAGGGLIPAQFQLDDDTDPTRDSSRNFNNVVPGSGYSLSETVPSGWDQASATCDDGSPVSNIALSPGEDVTCTFTNSKRGTIVAVKDAVPDDPQDFSFSAGGGLAPASFALDDDSDGTLSNTRTFNDVVPGSGYSLSETVPSGWDQASATCDDGSPVSNIDVEIGETVTCTFQNRKRGRIVIVHDAVPDDPQDFSFTAGGGLSPASFTLDDDLDPALANTQTFADVAIGSGYSVSETVPAGWDLASATCDDGSPVTNISVSAGETVTCTFTNHQRGQIVVVKDATPDDPQDFSFTAGGGLSPASFALDDDSEGTLSNTRTFGDVPAGGDYSLSESVPAGWDQTGATCDDGSPVGDISVAPAEIVTCTFSNRKRGRVVAVKDAVPNDAQDFSFTAGGGLSPTGFSLDDDSDPALSNTRMFNDVVPGGGYSLSETVPSGWDQASATCDDGSPVSNIDVAAGETVTCTFTNNRRAQIVVVKDAVPDDSQDFSFTAGGGLSPASFALDDDTDPTLSSTRSFSDVAPGSGYSISESVPGGWDQTAAACDDGSPVSNIALSPGEVVTCTFTNRKRGRIVAVKDSRPDDPQDFVFNAGGGLIPAQFQLDDDTDPTRDSTRNFNNVVPGNGYSLSETVPSGWDQASATCDDGSPVSNIDVGAGETVTCTFVNDKRGQITVVHDAVPDDAQDFTFTQGGGLPPGSFTLDDDLDPALSNTHTINDVPAGSGYSVAETVPAGWDLASAICDDGSPVSNIDVGAGEHVTCTFTSNKRGQIVVVKDATPDDPQDFSFTTGGGLSPASFALDDDADATLPNTRTLSDVTVGSGYSVAETVPSGWDQASATCDDGSPVSNIEVAPGETVTCTFANTKRGRIVAVKDARPDDPQDFSFSAGGGLAPASFALDDDSDGTLSNTRTFNGVVPGSGYSLSETVPSGWDQASATCDDGSPVSDIDVGPGETVTCTFANDRRGRIVIVKDAVPNDSQDFSFTAGGGLSPASFALDDDTDPTLPSTQTFDDVPPGSGYSFAETVPGGWDQASATCDDGSPVSNVTVSVGETVTCTFRNEQRGRIVVIKDATPDDPQDFSFSAGGGLSPASFALDDDTDPTLSNSRSFNDVLPGAGYSLSETVPSGWDQTAATCDDGSPASSIDVEPGETVTCTFVNARRGQVSVTKDSVPDDAQDFAFAAGGGLTPVSFALDDDLEPSLSNTRTFADVPAGSGYSLSETVPSGWDQTSATCDDGSPVSSISLSPGEHVSCTFTNTKRGAIVVVKDATPDDPQDFSFTAGGGLSPAGFALDDDSDGTLSNTRTFASVPPGSGYSISETVPGGWDQTAATCDDGSPVSDIDVAPGEIVTCTFANAKRGRIIAVKDATPDDPQNFSFTAAGGLSPASFALDDDSDPALSNTRSFNDVVPGSGYSLSETVPSGWDQASATCDDGSPVSNIDVTAGETVTCTFANRKRGTLVVVEDAVPNDAQDFSFTAGGGLSPGSFSLDDDSDPALASSRTFTDVVPGSGYSISHATPAGWDLDSATCDDGSPLSDIGIAPGETVTCTFVHHKHGSVTAVKQAQPNDPQDFSFTAGGGLSPTSFQLDDDSDPALSNTRTFNDVSAQSGYSLAETEPPGWDQTAATCDDGSPVSNIDVGPGEHVTCTFTNRRRGAIVVVQDSMPDDPQDFSFTAGGGLSPATFALDDDSDATLSNTRTFANVPATAGYSISQTLPSGWQPADATCDDGSPVSNIDVGPGETVTCTFHNDKRGKVVVVKAATPQDPQDFSFTAGGGLSPTSFQLDDDSDPALSNTRTFNDVAPGAGYSVSETVPGDWQQTGAACDDGSQPSNIDVGPGETVTCTFANRKTGTLVVVKDATPNDPQDFSFTAGGGLSPTSFVLDDDSDPTLSNTRTFSGVTPGGGYSIAETLPTGWSQLSATCSDGSPASNVNIAPGETVTCTFMNNRGYARPRGAAPMYTAMVVAYGECTSPNRTHGPALVYPSCNPPVQTSAYLTVGTPDVNSRSANMTGSVRFGVRSGNPGTSADEADVVIQSTVTDVRTKAGLDDYVGELEGRLTLRITDRLNGPGENEPGTTDVGFPFAVPCTATSGGGNIGSTCSVNTTADAILPGAVTETKRTIWAIDDVLIYDGGPDGIASTQDNTLFLRQGVFIP